MINKMHPAKALETAVFTLADLRQSGDSAHIRHTDIQVKKRDSWYIIYNGSTQYSPRNRNQAIDTLKALLIEGRK